MDYKGRLARARLALQQTRLDALLVTHLPNIAYLCRFTGTACVLLISQREYVFFTDGRYTEQAHQEVKGVRIKTQLANSAPTAAAGWIANQKSWRTASMEA